MARLKNLDLVGNSLLLMVFAAVRIREILENVELAMERLSPGAVRSAQVIANVANFLNLKDTEMGR